MLDGLRATWRGLKNFQVAGYSYIWANLAFVALSLPLLTAPAALSALFRVGHVAHTQPSDADLGLFWETFRRNLLRALPWGALNAAFAAVNFYNLWAYADAEGLGIALLRGVWIIAAVIWLGMLLYTWPIYYEMETPTVSGAARNALVMVLQNPGFTLAVLAVVALLALASTVLVAAWALLTCGAIAAIANAAVLDRLERFRALS